MKTEQTSYRKLMRVLWLIILIPLIFIICMLVAASYSDLPPFEELENPKSKQATQLISSDGEILGKYYIENRTEIPFDSISTNVINALIATEDERFYSHSGIDLEGTARAAVFLGGRGGASTITQQLAKMLFSKNPRTKWTRIFQKFQEWIISVQLEKRYTKQEILAMYLNKFDFINQAVGIQSASNVYFNTEPDSLNIQQSAMLVGMLKNPALYNPRRFEERVTKRREVVLDQMRKNEFLTQEEYDSLRVLPLGLDYQKVDHNRGLAPYFREVLRTELSELLSKKDPALGRLIYAKKDGTPYNLYSDGLKIYTTIDVRMQKYAEWAVKEHLGTELQKDFLKELKKFHRKNSKKWPYEHRTPQKRVNMLIEKGKGYSQRYLKLAGKKCPICQRGANSIEEIEKNDTLFYHCKVEACNYYRPVISEDSITAIFNVPVPMTVFSWQGEIDTILSPKDSIRYYKSLLQTGLMSMDPRTGYVKAWVGGIDFKTFKYDHVRQGKRQVGSTFKPFVYATAIRDGVSPCHEVSNVITCFKMPKDEPDYCPKNSDNQYAGDDGYQDANISLKTGLARSMNTVTAWVMKNYGGGNSYSNFEYHAVPKLARQMGIKSDLAPVPALCLGVADVSVYEMVAANCTFVNKGIYTEPIIITKIEDKNGNIIYETVPKTNEALDPSTAYTMLELMKGVCQPGGTGYRVRMAKPYGRLRYPIAGKTGTTQNNSDGWFMGLTPDLVTGVWVGGDDRDIHFVRTHYGQGANMALPIWGYYMNKVYADKSIKISKKDFEKPKKVNIELNCEKYKKNQSNNSLGGDSDDPEGWD